MHKKASDLPAVPRQSNQIWNAPTKQEIRDSIQALGKSENPTIPPIKEIYPAGAPKFVADPYARRFAVADNVYNQKKNQQERDTRIFKNLTDFRNDVGTGTKALVYTIGDDLNTLGYDVDSLASTGLLHFLRGVGAKEDTLTAIEERIRDNYRQKGSNHKVYTDAQNALKLSDGSSPYKQMPGVPGYSLQDTLKWGVYAPFIYALGKPAGKGVIHTAKAPMRALGRPSNMVKAVRGMRTTPFKATYQLAKNSLGLGADTLATTNVYGMIPTYTYPNIVSMYERVNGTSGQLSPQMSAVKNYGFDMVNKYPWLFPVQYTLLKGYTTPTEAEIRTGPDSSVLFRTRHGYTNARNQALYNMAYPAKTLSGFNPEYDMNAMGDFVYDILSNHPNENVRNIVTGSRDELTRMREDIINNAKKEGKTDDQIQRELMGMEQNYYNAFIPYISSELHKSMKDPDNKEYFDSIPLDITRFTENELMNVLHYTMPYAMHRMIPSSTFDNFRMAAKDYRNNLINGGR